MAGSLKDAYLLSIHADPLTRKRLGQLGGRQRGINHNNDSKIIHRNAIVKELAKSDIPKSWISEQIGISRQHVYRISNDISTHDEDIKLLELCIRKQSTCKYCQFYRPCYFHIPFKIPSL